MKPANRFLMKETLSDQTIRRAIEELKAEGAKVIVASSAFGVDDNEAEETVRRLVVEGRPWLRRAAMRSPSSMV